MKRKLNLNISQDAKHKLQVMAEWENRSVSNLVEVMADERAPVRLSVGGVIFSKELIKALAK